MPLKEVFRGALYKGSTIMAYVALKRDVAQYYVHLGVCMHPEEFSAENEPVSASDDGARCLPFDADPTPDGYLRNLDVSRLIGQVPLGQILSGGFNPVAEVNRLLEQASEGMCWWSEETLFVAGPHDVAIVVTGAEFAAFGRKKHQPSNSTHEISSDFYIVTQSGIVEFSFKGVEESAEPPSAVDEQKLAEANVAGNKFLAAIKSSKSPDDLKGGCALYEDTFAGFLSQYNGQLKNLQPVIGAIFKAAFKNCDLLPSEMFLVKIQKLPELDGLREELSVALREDKWRRIREIQARNSNDDLDDLFKLLNDVGQTDEAQATLKRYIESRISTNNPAAFTRVLDTLLPKISNPAIQSELLRKMKATNLQLLIEAALHFSTVDGSQHLVEACIEAI